MKKKLPRSIRKFIRLEKARIRRQIFDLKEQKKKIDELYQKFFPPVLKTTENSPKPLVRAKKQHENSRNIQVSNK